MPDSALLLICSYSRLLELCLSHEVAAEVVITMLITCRSLGAAAYRHPPSPVHGRSQADRLHSVKQVLCRRLVERSCGRSGVGLWRNKCSAAHQAQPCADHPVCSGHWGAPHCTARKASGHKQTPEHAVVPAQRPGQEGCVLQYCATVLNLRQCLEQPVACHELDCSKRKVLSCGCFVPQQNQ